VLFSHAGISGAIKPITEYPRKSSTPSWRSMFGHLPGLQIRFASNEGRREHHHHIQHHGRNRGSRVCAYVTSKHALIGLMRTVAKEAAPRKIRVNVVARVRRHSFQSKIEERLTEIVARTARSSSTTLFRSVVMRAEEIARMVLFLLRSKQLLDWQRLYV